jgi:hypothetical protein
VNNHDSKLHSLTIRPLAVKKNGTIRYRFLANNRSGDHRKVTILIAGIPVEFEIPPKTIRRLGGQPGFVLPSAVPVFAYADGDAVTLTVL